MLTENQLRYLGLQASHRAFALEAECNELRAQNHALVQALEQAKAALDRMRRPPAGPADVIDMPTSPAPRPPAGMEPEDDGVAQALDELATVDR
jgi:hypothetical protein